jgi:hypothetical protein
VADEGGATTPQATAAGDALRAGGSLSSRLHRVTSGLLPEHVLALVLASLVFAVHDVGYLLGQAYWNDESWVAVTTRFPLSSLPAVTSSTPIGWSLLLRLVSVPRSQSGRLLPLAFAALAVVAAYWLARMLGWKRRETAVVAGALAGCAALLVPAMLVRDDLKQYTADAFTALLILAIAAGLERRWSRWALLALSASVWAGMLLSDPAAFVGAAVFTGLVASQLVGRNWRRLAEVAVAGAVTGALALLVYKAFDARAVVPGLTAFWSAYFPPASGSFGAISHFVVGKLGAVHAYFALGPAWLAVPLVLAGVVTIARLGRPATAIAVVLLWPEMYAVSALKRYPFLDLRTSTFLIAVTAVVAAIGVVGSAAALGRLLRSRIASFGVLVVVSAVALAAFADAASPYVRSHLIPSYGDVNEQAEYVLHHAGAGDPIVVNANSNWGFAFYWPIGQPSHRPDSAFLQGYEAFFPGQPRIIVATGPGAAAIKAAVSQALAQLRPGECERVWLIRTFLRRPEFYAWSRVLRELRLNAVTLPDGVSYIRAGPRSCP